MNVEHTKQLLDGVISAGGSDELINALRSELDAKLMPITAEALLADGWWRNPEWNDGWYSYSIDGAVIIDIRIIEPLRVGFFDSGDYAGFSGESMYDVRELVRILGGSQ